MFSWKEFLEIIILMFSFITGQIVHILKISKYDNDLLIGDWFRNNKLTFITTIFCGLGILETLMSQIAYPVNIVGWFTLFYTGFIIGFTGNSLGNSISVKYTNGKTDSVNT